MNGSTTSVNFDQLYASYTHWFNVIRDVQYAVIDNDVDYRRLLECLEQVTTSQQQVNRMLACRNREMDDKRLKELSQTLDGLHRRLIVSLEPNCDGVKIEDSEKVTSKVAETVGRSSSSPPSRLVKPESVNLSASQITAIDRTHSDDKENESSDSSLSFKTSSKRLYRRRSTSSARRSFKKSPSSQLGSLEFETEVDALVSNLLQDSPEIGVDALHAMIKSMGHNVPRAYVRASSARLRPHRQTHFRNRVKLVKGTDPTLSWQENERNRLLTFGVIAKEPMSDTPCQPRLQQGGASPCYNLNSLVGLGARKGRTERTPSRPQERSASC